MLEHLPLADVIAATTARNLFPLVERDDLIQVAQEVLGSLRSGEPAAPYLPRGISDALQHHLHDGVGLVRNSHCLQEQGQFLQGHSRLDAHGDGEPPLLAIGAAFHFYRPKEGDLPGLVSTLRTVAVILLL